MSQSPYSDDTIRIFVLPIEMYEDKEDFYATYSPRQARVVCHGCDQVGMASGDCLDQMQECQATDTPYALLCPTCGLRDFLITHDPLSDYDEEASGDEGLLALARAQFGLTGPELTLRMLVKAVGLHLDTLAQRSRR